MGLSRNSLKYANLRKRVSRINNSFQTTDESMKRQTFSWKIFFFTNLRSSELHRIKSVRGECEKIWT